MRFLFKAFLFLVFTISLFSMGWLSHSFYILPDEKKVEVSCKETVFEKIKRRKFLNVVLLNSASTYYIGSDGAQGFEYELLSSYAQHLGVELNITTVHTTKEAIKMSENHNIDIISASLSKTDKRKKLFNFGPSYFEVQEQVICKRAMKRNKKLPKNIKNLKNLKIMVGEYTSYSETIKALQKDGFDINVTFTSEYSTEELLEKVNKKEIDCTIADSNVYALNLRYFPEIVQAFTISGREQLAWILAKDSDDLKADMYLWLNIFNQSGKLSQLKDHYYGDVHFFNYFNTKIFYKRIKTRLPRYEKYFKEAGTKYNVPWKLLAAISYQESYWNPKAKSFTGVKGLMMLTRSTAKFLKIKNRLDPKQSIIGGTRHLKQMLRLIPDDVVGENRLKFALASYNVGFGHILDARKLARKMGLNHSIWSDIKKTLPLLSQKRYYRSCKYGYARGSEPVYYVDSIYNFRNILENID